eukprot:814730-Amphidinium_carterae.1
MALSCASLGIGLRRDVLLRGSALNSGQDSPSGEPFTKALQASAFLSSSGAMVTFHGDRALVVKSVSQTVMNDAPREEREAENYACRSGLRDGARAVLGLQRLAKTMAEALEVFGQLDSPTAAVPDEKLLRVVRPELCSKLGLSAEEAEQRLPACSWRWRLLGQLVELRRCCSWLAEGWCSRRDFEGYPILRYLPSCVSQSVQG